MISVHTCAISGRSVSIVSNNSVAAIEANLANQGLDGYVAGIFGRVSGDVASMKPNPRLLLEAVRAVDGNLKDCIFIGDAARDVGAGHAADVATIGYANKPGKEGKLKAAGAVAIVDLMQLIADHLI
ncbi:HAD family hydrolase [Kitasatospora griseola]|uniref:HAD family hydrolase n=1 Tax=Kitasatospora griseola TaxID=2064 RepID=UPI0038133A0B